MVYESDFYTTRRPYTRPNVSAYSVTRRPVPWEMHPTVPRPSLVPPLYTAYGNARRIKTPRHYVVVDTPERGRRAEQQYSYSYTSDSSTASSSSPYTAPTRSYNSTSERLDPKLAPGIGKGQTYHRSIPVVAHKRMTLVTPPPHTNRVRPSVFLAEIDRIYHKARPHVGKEHLEDFLNTNAIVSFDDETRLIRAQTNALLRKIHAPVPRRNKPLFKSYQNDELGTPIYSDAYIQRLVGPVRNVQQEIFSISHYPEPAKNYIGKGHLACLSFAGGRAIAKRRNLVLAEDERVKNDVKFLSYYDKTRTAANGPRAQIKAFAGEFRNTPPTLESAYIQTRASRPLIGLKVPIGGSSSKEREESSRKKEKKRAAIAEEDYMLPKSSTRPKENNIQQNMNGYSEDHISEFKKESTRPVFSQISEDDSVSHRLSSQTSQQDILAEPSYEDELDKALEEPLQKDKSSKKLRKQTSKQDELISSASSQNSFSRQNSEVSYTDPIISRQTSMQSDLVQPVSRQTSAMDEPTKPQSRKISEQTESPKSLSRQSSKVEEVTKTPSRKTSQQSEPTKPLSRQSSKVEEVTKTPSRKTSQQSEPTPKVEEEPTKPLSRQSSKVEEETKTPSRKPSQQSEPIKPLSTQASQVEEKTKPLSRQTSIQAEEVSKPLSRQTSQADEPVKAPSRKTSQQDDSTTTCQQQEALERQTSKNEVFSVNEDAIAPLGNEETPESLATEAENLSKSDQQANIVEETELIEENKKAEEINVEDVFAENQSTEEIPEKQDTDHAMDDSELVETYEKEETGNVEGLEVEKELVSTENDFVEVKSTEELPKEVSNINGDDLYGVNIQSTDLEEEIPSKSEIETDRKQEVVIEDISQPQEISSNGFDYNEQDVDESQTEKNLVQDSIFEDENLITKPTFAEDNFSHIESVVEDQTDLQENHKINNLNNDGSSELEILLEKETPESVVGKAHDALNIEEESN